MLSKETNSLTKINQYLHNSITKHCRNLGNGILDIKALLNHQISYTFIEQCITKLHIKLIIKHSLQPSITKIIAIPISGITPAYSMLNKLQKHKKTEYENTNASTSIVQIEKDFEEEIKLIFPRQSIPITFDSQKYKIYHTSYASHTRKNCVHDFYISGEFLNTNERILIVDDFLASGTTVIALLELLMPLLKEENVCVIGAAFIVEKKFENGRKNIEKWCKNNKYPCFPIESAIVIEDMEDGKYGDIQLQK